MNTFIYMIKTITIFNKRILICNIAAPNGSCCFTTTSNQQADVRNFLVQLYYHQELLRKAKEAGLLKAEAELLKTEDFSRIASSYAKLKELDEKSRSLGLAHTVAINPEEKGSAQLAIQNLSNERYSEFLDNKQKSFKELESQHNAVVRGLEDIAIFNRENENKIPSTFKLPVNQERIESNSNLFTGTIFSAQA